MSHQFIDRRLRACRVLLLSLMPQSAIVEFVWLLLTMWRAAGLNADAGLCLLMLLLTMCCVRYLLGLAAIFDILKGNGW